MDEITKQTITEFKRKVKEYETLGTNPEVLKQLTMKERMAVSEMSAMLFIKVLNEIEKKIRLLGFISLMNICAYISLIIWNLKK